MREPHDQHHTSWGNLEAISSKISISITCIQHRLEALANQARVKERRMEWERRSHSILVSRTTVYGSAAPPKQIQLLRKLDGLYENKTGPLPLIMCKTRCEVG